MVRKRVCLLALTLGAVFGLVQLSKRRLSTQMVGASFKSLVKFTPGELIEVRPAVYVQNNMIFITELFRWPPTPRREQ